MNLFGICLKRIAEFVWERIAEFVWKRIAGRCQAARAGTSPHTPPACEPHTVAALPATAHPILVQPCPPPHTQYCCILARHRTPHSVAFLPATVHEGGGWGVFGPFACHARYFNLSCHARYFNPSHPIVFVRGGFSSTCAFL